MTQVTLSKTALAAIDQVRAARGIRTRAKALEVVAVEAATLTEYPLLTKMRTAKTAQPDAYEIERIEAYLERERNGTSQWFSGAEILAKAAELRKLRD
jgi:hypothetical protein